MLRFIQPCIIGFRLVGASETFKEMFSTGKQLEEKIMYGRILYVLVFKRTTDQMIDVY